MCRRRVLGSKTSRVSEPDGPSLAMHEPMRSREHDATEHTAGETSMRASRGLLAALVLVGSLVAGVARAAPDAGLPPASMPVDRASPRAALGTFLTLGDRGDFASAAHVLDVRALDRDARPDRAQALAESLHDTLRRRGVLSTNAAATLVGTRTTIEVVPLARGELPIVLSRERLADGTSVWVFSRETVASIPLLAAQERPGPRSWSRELTPPAIRYASLAGLAGWQWVGLAVALLGALVVLVCARGLARRVVRRALPAGKLTEDRRDEEARVLSGRLAVLAAVAVALGLLDGIVTSGPAQWWLDRLGTVALVLAVGALVARVADAFLARIEAATLAESGWRARGVRTKILVFRRIAHVVGGTALAAAALVQFEPVRELGVSLLASAGLAGVVLGFAAQKTLGNLVAGLQLSLSQPLRIGDQVTIEGEFGTVEEITLSYVVVRIWDERRLVVPTSRLLEQPFRNHTRVGTEQVGEVRVKCDFETDVHALRAGLEHVVREHPLFDGRTFAVQVVDADERAMTLRVLVSARSPSELFDLRCDVRERTILMLRDTERSLPRTRFSPARLEEALVPDPRSAS